MVGLGPDPPDPSENEMPPRPNHTINLNDDSDEDNIFEYEGYEPLPQGPELYQPNISDSSEDEYEDAEPHNVPMENTGVPSIETVDTEVTRTVWMTPRSDDSIEMSTEKAEQVMSAMANFDLPSSSIPEWAHIVSEDQWKQQLQDKIENLKKSTR